MKIKALTIALFFGLFTGCKSFDPTFLNPGGEAFNPKLPSMEKAVENNLVAIVTPTGQTYGASPQDVITLFDREVSEIITNPYGDKRGYLLLKVNTIESKADNFLLPCVAGFTLGASVLAGIPYTTSKSIIEVQIDVLDQNRKLIGSYRGSGEKKFYHSLYKNGYREYARVTYLLAVKEGIQNAKNKMKPDLNRLVAELDSKDLIRLN